MAPIVKDTIVAAKENPILTAVSIITPLGLILGAFLTIDERYAHAEEIKQLKADQQVIVNQNRYDLQQSTSSLRKQSLEDKIFEIELLPVTKRSTYDSARLNKYQRDLGEVNKVMQTPPPVAQ